MKPALLAFCLALSGLVSQCRADSVSITMTGVNGASGNGVYVGAYYGQINGTTVMLYCDDYANHSSIGQTWIATVSTFADLSNALYGSVPDALNKYRQVAWLIDRFGDNSSPNWGDIHFALWSIFNPSAVTLSPAAQQWLASAQTQATGNTSLDGKYVIYTPVIAGQTQEFLSPAPTPEPGSILLLATALAGVFLLLRRRVYS